jgi:hypothetical protein
MMNAEALWTQSYDIFVSACHQSLLIYDEAKRTGKWLGTLSGRLIHHVETASVEVERVVSSVDGLSALVRLATAVSALVNGFFVTLYGCALGFISLSDSGFTGLIDASRFLRVPSYFMGRGISDDIGKKRFLCICAKIVQSVCDIANFVLWYESKGGPIVSKKAALHWMMWLPLRSCLSGLSAVSYFLVGVDKGVEVAYGNRNPAVITDTISSFAEVAVGVLLLLPGIPFLPIACLELVAAGVGFVSNFVGAEGVIEEKRSFVMP